MRIRFRPAANVDEAIRIIESLAANIFNDALATRPDTTANDRRDHYVRWFNQTEKQLTAFFNRDAVLDIMETPRHRDICLMPGAPHLWATINSEVDAKAETFRGLGEQLSSERSRLRAAPDSRPAVLDSNVLLQCLPPDQIPWRQVVDEPARLMIPLRVLEELDQKKYGGNKRLSDVSRAVLSWIEDRFAENASGPVSVGRLDDSTVELLFPDSPRYKPGDADEEVLDVFDQVHAYVPSAILVTGDKAMRLRARARLCAVAEVPRRYLRVD